jgi:hypothetical protein
MLDSSTKEITMKYFLPLILVTFWVGLGALPAGTLAGSSELVPDVPALSKIWVRSAGEAGPKMDPNG